MRTWLLFSLTGRRRIYRAYREQVRQTWQARAQRDQAAAAAEALQDDYDELHKENLALHATALFQHSRESDYLLLLQRHGRILHVLNQVVQHAASSGHDPDALQVLQHLLHHDDALDCRC